MLVGLWNELDGWFRDELNASKQSLSVFLQRRAPLWHQVGRVCFHLAENRRDPDYPFAFMATYAPSTLGNGKKIQYQPLSKALQQYAGAENKDALIKLLSPIQLASESSELVGQLVSSGDVYAPLAWTPREAYQFLKDVPFMEQSGITVRLPDWWKKRPRPRWGLRLATHSRNDLTPMGCSTFVCRSLSATKSLRQKSFRPCWTVRMDSCCLRGNGWKSIVKN